MDDFSQRASIRFITHVFRPTFHARASAWIPPSPGMLAVAFFAIDWVACVAMGGFQSRRVWRPAVPAAGVSIPRIPNLLPVRLFSSVDGWSTALNRLDPCVLIAREKSDDRKGGRKG